MHFMYLDFTNNIPIPMLRFKLNAVSLWMVQYLNINISNLLLVRSKSYYDKIINDT